MCRWLAYSGPDLYMDELVIRPRYSLIDQSLAARQTHSTTNGDGFGLGWYGTRGSPGLYRSIRPAWNDSNLRDLAHQIRSPLFMAHVRATTGTSIQQSNCHPFRHGKWLFVHNGLIHNFPKVHRELLMAVSPGLFNSIEGTTDSELMFFLALTFGLEKEPIRAMERMAGLVEDVCRRNGTELGIQMSVGLSDGERLFAFRYSTENASRTLFHSRSLKALSELNPSLSQIPRNAVAVVSEPLNELTDYWEEVPESTSLLVTAGSVESCPFVPRKPDTWELHEPDPVFQSAPNR